MGKFEERFWSKADRSNDCWVWTSGKSSNGYGLVKRDSRTQYAHRVAYELTYGPIPAGSGHHGTVVAHRCDNRACCNPQHLFLATQKENIADRDAKGRQGKAERHGRAKLTKADVLAIRSAIGTQQAIAAAHGVTQQQVSRIRRREKWKHLA